jgi:hypothetical protein
LSSRDFSITNVIPETQSESVFAAFAIFCSNSLCFLLFTSKSSVTSVASGRAFFFFFRVVYADRAVFIDGTPVPKPPP